MNLQQLRYVVATSELGTMTAAAGALHVAQPALSRAVRALEQELGVIIFARDGRGLRLTDEGRDIIAIAARVLSEVDCLTALGKHAAVRAVATRAQARELGLPAVSRHLKEHGVHVQLSQTASRDEAFDAVRCGQAQIGIVELPAPADMDVIALGWQEFVVVHPPGWDLPDPVTLHELADVPLLSPPIEDWRHTAIVAAFCASGLEPTFATTPMDRDLLPTLVVEGAGVAFSYGRQAAAVTAAGAGLVHLEPPGMRRIGIIHAEAPNRQVKAFADCVRAEAEGLLLPEDSPRLARAARITGPVLLFHAGLGRNHPSQQERSRLTVQS